MKLILSAAAALSLFAPHLARAWDYEGHRIVNQLGLATLPADFPAFVKDPAAQERIAFLAGEPDRWRNTPETTLQHFNAPDHYIDVEDLEPYGLDPHSLSHFRYEFTGQLAVQRHLHPEKFPAIDASKNKDKTRTLTGFLPWTIAEFYGKLKSEFSYLKAFEEGGGTPEEIANAKQNILYTMGVMGHFVGDASQPLHTTKHFNGWVGENPNHYATNTTFHSWIDGGYIRKIKLTAGDLKGKVRPAKSLGAAPDAKSQEDIFPLCMSFIVDHFKLVEPLYRMNKEGTLSDTGAEGSKGRAFMSGQLIKAGEFLGDLWYTAWKNAPVDSYLKGQLTRRKSAADPAP